MTRISNGKGFDTRLEVSVKESEGPIEHSQNLSGELAFEPYSWYSYL